jgi:prepilin-type N-terminal cleavage/methylation domain-containing protein
MNKTSGMTLIEVMITLVIAGILIGYAVPNLRVIYLKQSLNTKANDMLVDFAFARAEAVNTGYPVSVVANGTWKNGWQVESDVNGDDTIQESEILRKTTDIEKNLSFKDSITPENTLITFNSTGELSVNTARTIEIQHSGLSIKKILKVGLSGNTSITSD